MWIRCLSIGLLLLVAATSCGAPGIAFPDANERTLLGPASYRMPRWSMDGRYVLVVEGLDDNLTIYDLKERRSWQVAGRGSKAHFDWTPSGQIAYLSHRADLSGAPFPDVEELHVIERDGTNDRVVATNLYSAGVFMWLRDSQNVIIELVEREAQTRDGDVYLLNVPTGQRRRLVTRQELGIRSFSTMALSRDEKTLLLDADRGEPTPISNIKLLLAYDLDSRRVSSEINLSQMFGKSSLTPGMRGGISGRNLSYLTAGRNRWAISTVSVVEGDCFRTSLYFVNLDDLTKNFCITTPNVVIREAVLSPDASQLAYLNYVGGNSDFLTIANITADIRARLER